MNRSERLLLGASGGLVVLVGGLLVAGRQQPRAASASRTLIDRLDAYIRERFRTAEGVFGMNRVAVGPHDVWTLMPGPEPKAITAAFEQSGVRTYFRTVALKRGVYTWGTPVIPAYEATTRLDVPVRFATRKHADSAMRNNPGTYRNLREVDPSTHHQSLSGPIRIATDLTGKEEIPDLPKLREGIQRSIFVLKAGRSHTFRAGDWEVVARPIRATAQKCLSCHQDERGRPARLNDTLGLALYATRPSAAVRRVAQR